MCIRDRPCVGAPLLEFDGLLAQESNETAHGPCLEGGAQLGVLALGGPADELQCKAPSWPQL
eukprot:7416606-Alexandrium_andersonii.AAC.1